MIFDLFVRVCVVWWKQRVGVGVVERCVVDPGLGLGCYYVVVCGVGC